MPKKTHGLARGLDSLLPEVDMICLLPNFVAETKRKD